MRIYTRGGDLAFKTFTFPDGQPHFELLTQDNSGFFVATIEAAIRNPGELFEVQLAADVLRSHGYAIRLDVRYLMGARMDRSIGFGQPFTLATVARTILSCGFHSIRILDPHSRVATDLLNAKAVLPHGPVQATLDTLGDVLVVIPDKGAIERVTALVPRAEDFVRCDKVRDVNTGRITKLTVEAGHRVKGERCLIIDDCCDGGATFRMIAMTLRDFGAKEVHLFVTHGIFSKGPEIEKIDKIFTTDSYAPWHTRSFGPITIPISMKEM